MLIVVVNIKAKQALKMQKSKRVINPVIVLITMAREKCTYKEAEDMLRDFLEKTKY